VKQIVQRDLAHRYRHMRLKDVRYLAVDEFHVGKKGKFMTVALDLESGHILHMAKGRGAAALTKFLRRLRQARAKVRAVACDLSAACWSAVVQGLPKAKIVFDHFHIIKLANEKIDELRRALQREAAQLDRRYLKGTRFLLNRLLGEHGQGTTGRDLRRFARGMEARRGDPQGDAEAKVFATGWRIGAEDFAGWLAEKLGRRGVPSERARERRETDEQLAECLVREGLAAAAWDDEGLRKWGARATCPPWSV
jgi:hypothetical protein